MRTGGSARAIVLLSIALLAGAAGAQDLAPQERLTRMSNALRRLDFEGSFIYEHDGRVDALRIFHLGGEAERERLVSLNGPRGEIVRDERSVTCVSAGTPPIQFANRPGQPLLPLVPNVRQLGTNYTLTDGGDDRIAGYGARIVDIAPRDQYRYGYRLWLEKDTHLLLRSAVIDASRRTLEQFMFVALDVGAKPSETDLLPDAGSGTAISPSDEVTVNARPRWQVAAPVGFRLVRTQRPLGPTSQAEHLVYSDGVASVSVYIEPRASGAQAGLETTVMHGVLSVDMREDGALRITALGNVPPATVQAMARGVRVNGPG